MSANIDVLNPDQPKRVLMVVANPAVSQTTGWPIGFWAAELTHPYYEFTEKGYQVEIVSPQGGKLQIDSFSDPRDASGYSAHDLISMGFLSTPRLAALLDETRSIAAVKIADYDALFLAGGQSPMYTFINDTKLHQFVADFYEAGKVVAIVCHGTCVLLKTRLSSGKLLVEGKTWTGFANSEEQFADAFVGKRIQPFWIEDEAKQIPNTNFIVSGRFKPFAVRDGRLITGQQQYSGAAAAKLVIEALGV
ncbi:MAG: type 1 glutamine amidotransferase domain-containing protein [candidate division KSB1 bacterium]|nr:type 1 glutamine amidotransferase domain-containing protein [candidate division KSB1 bacterium]MDZ7273086.1 type 1 glutamine amidotransferase domain-containing protein [candidate division KSB1 bacterium]MDZ7285189.1 type 1 glutamine amidotransferase domain-containing protein [candidate division KSB1 bacterium]MDZ7298221.1 type 1 glutamine amidotransferase domain-containing protein [candidate division KSB1 bacterium]MDZ7306895.1 type 1 glutamine amidotransferase domain-containing protein [can